MVIGVDAREIENGVRTGIGRALSVFLHWMVYHSPATQCVLFSTRPLPVQFGRGMPNMVSADAPTFMWDQLVLPRMLLTCQAEGFLSPYYKIPLSTRVPCVSMIFDLMYLTCEVYRRRVQWPEWWYYRTVGRIMVRKARRIVTSSEYSRDEIVAFYGVHPSRISVVPLGLSREYLAPSDRDQNRKRRQRLGVERKYVLYVGTFKPHKNVDALINAFSVVHERHPDIALVLAGSMGDAGERCRDLVSHLGLSEHVRFTGFIDIMDQVALYAGAETVVVPSLHEGFGYPALEAMACGAPVVCSNQTSLPEVVGSAALMFDPRRPDQIADRIDEVLSSTSIRDRMVKQGHKQSAGFDEEHYSRALWTVLQSAFSMSGINKS